MLTLLSNYLYKVFFGISIVLLLLAILEELMRNFGWTLSFVTYEPGRLLEIAATLAIFVIALLLRQIRDNTAKD
jgi:hypothetical protein